MLYYAVLPFVVGVIKNDPMLVLLITLTVTMAVALALISETVNPPAPPYVIGLLFRQVRVKLGLTGNVTEIDDDYATVELTRIEVGNLLPLELWI